MMVFLIKCNKECLDENIWKYELNLSANQTVFPENLKIAFGTPLFKSGEYLLTNYRPTSILPCFSRILEGIMYNRVYDFLTENKIYMKNCLTFSLHI